MQRELQVSDKSSESEEASWACGSMVDAVFVTRVKFKLEAVLEQKSPSTDSNVPYLSPSLRSVRLRPKCGIFLGTKTRDFRGH